MAGSPWTPLESSDEGWSRVAWRLSTQSDAERKCAGVWVVYNESCSNLIFVKNLSKIICWIRYFLHANLVGVSVDDNFRYHMPKIASTYDRNRSRVAMMVMDCLCLSIHSFKFITLGFIPLRAKKSLLWMMSGDSDKWQVSLDNINNSVSDNSSYDLLFSAYVQVDNKLSKSNVYFINPSYCH